MVLKDLIYGRKPTTLEYSEARERTSASAEPRNFFNFYGKKKKLKIHNAYNLLQLLASRKVIHNFNLSHVLLKSELANSHIRPITVKHNDHNCYLDHKVTQHNLIIFHCLYDPNYYDRTHFGGIG